MKKLLILSFMALLISYTSKAQPANEFEKKLQKVHQTWFDGLLSENAQVIDQLLSDDVTLGFPGGNVVSKREFIDLLKNETLFYDSAYHEYSKIRIYGNIGVINGRSNLTYRFKRKDGKFFNGHEKLTYTAVYVLNESLRMVAWQSTTRPNE